MPPRRLRRAGPLLGAALGLAAGLAAAPAGAAEPGDVAYVNGKVFTADASGWIAEAFVVRGDRFVAVGTNAAMRAYAAPKVVDLKGRFVSPGLSDAHLHGEGGGDNVDLSKARTLAELYAAVGERVRASGPGVLVMSNTDWHEMQLAERRLPTARELDVVSPDNPVVLIRGGHSYILNSAALARWNITRATAAPAGGQISRDAAGELTGELFDNAKSLVSLPPPPPTDIDDVLATQRTLNSYGITSARIIGGYRQGAERPNIFDAWKLFKEVRDSGRATARFDFFISNIWRGPATPEDYVAVFANSGLKQGDGDAWLRVGGVKLIVDGGFEGGHMSEPYAEPYGRDGTYYGLVVTPPDRYTDIVRALNKAGWTVATHAVGDAGVEQVLDAYEAADADSPIARKRWTIEHAFLTTPEQRARAKRLGLFLSVQDHLYVAGPAFKNYLGEARAERITPLRTYLADGQKVALGTDAPVIPVNPFWEFYHFITRDTVNDGVYGADERVADRALLLRTMTAGWGRLIGNTRVGTIEPGSLADFAVLSDDFLTVPAERIRDMRALATYVGGREVYRASDY
jgi:predicted amidohydrolase YtcJ